MICFISTRVRTIRRHRRTVVTLNTIKIVTQTYPIGKDLSGWLSIYELVVIVSPRTTSYSRKKEIKFNVQELFCDDDH
jgi:hypothetical protein